MHYTCVGTSRPVVTYASNGKTAILDGTVDYQNTTLPATLTAVPTASDIRFEGPGRTVIEGPSRAEFVFTSYRRQFKCSATAALR